MTEDLPKAQSIVGHDDWQMLRSRCRDCGLDIVRHVPATYLGGPPVRRCHHCTAQYFPGVRATWRNGYVV